MTNNEFKKLKDRYYSIDKDDNHDIDDYTLLIDDLFLALENALLKLKNRGVEISDIKHRNKIEAGNLSDIIGKVLAWVDNEEKGKEIIKELSCIQTRLRK